MTDDVALRPCQASDRDAVHEIYSAAFPDEDLIPLLQDLSVCGEFDAFVAAAADRPVGHIGFTRCGLQDDDRFAALLGPLAVRPEFSRQGLGGRLVRSGLDAMERRGAAVILVLGDPAYYAQFGFEPEAAVLPPYPLREDWADAWRSKWVSPNGLHSPKRLVVPEAWANPALWS
ncbi:MAG: N-acetyltransferase [Pseudomonadota bacterium]